MEAIPRPTEEECYLWAILSDPSGFDLAEFTFSDPERDDGIWRAWPFQWKWYHNMAPLSIDQSARSIGKTRSIIVRAYAFPFLHPQGEMLITAPELVHLLPVVSLVERQVQQVRMSRELLMGGRSRGITHRPFAMEFRNGARIFGRIPQRDGRGILGTHPIWLELDEAQSYPPPGWTEIVETLKRGSEGAIWRAHGVTRGVRDHFYKFTQPGTEWQVNRYSAMNRPTWSDQERDEKIEMYGSRDHPDYRRNILGLHGDAQNPLFATRRLMLCQPAGTIVQTPGGAVPIESLCEDDSIFNAIGTGRVTRVAKTSRDKLIRINFAGGRSVTASPEHPYLTTDGWRQAADCRPGDQFPRWGEVMRNVWRSDRGQQKQSVLLKGLLREVAWGALPGLGYEQENAEELWMVWNRILSTIEGRSVLLKGLCRQMEWGSAQTARSQALRMVSSGVRSSSCYKQVLHGIVSGALGECYSSQKAPETVFILPQASGPGWIADGAVPAMASAGSTVAAATMGIAFGRPGDGDRVVYNRFGTDRIDDCRGGRRTIPSLRANEIARRAARCMVDSARVESVEVLERGHPEFDRLSGGSNTVELYDLTVSGHPSFVVTDEWILSHNCVDQDQDSEYNTKDYQFFKIEDEYLEDMGGVISRILDFPPHHLENNNGFYVGMDVGYLRHPSEIVVFRKEYPKGDKSKPFILRLIVRIHLKRIKHSAQADAMAHVMNFYKPRVFAMDSTGVGLPLFQDLQDRSPQFAKMIKGYNFCTDEETEILTKRGWLRYDEVQIGDETLGLTADGTSRWTRVTAVNVFDGPHEVHSLEGQAHSSVTTASHRWLAKPHTGNGKLRWASTTEFVAGRIRYGIPVAATRADNPISPTVKDDLVELAAWYFTEGWLGYGDSINIGQSATASPVECARIEALLTRLMGPGQFNPGRGNGSWGQGWTCSNSPALYRGSGYIQNAYHVKDREVSSAVLGLVVGEDKVPTPEFLTSLTDEQLDLFIEVCMLGDGSNTLVVRPERSTRMTNFFHQAVEVEARSRAFEMACALRGEAFTSRIYKNQSCRTTNRLCCRQVWTASMRHEKRVIEGIVWCPTTDVGTWLARRDGTVYFTGNSEKILVDFDQSIEVDEYKDDAVDKAGIKKNVLDHSSDVLRSLVDAERVILPWDRDLIGEFQGQVWTVVRDNLNTSGKRDYSVGNFHALDACKLACLGMSQETIEEFVKDTKDKHEPVSDIFLSF